MNWQQVVSESPYLAFFLIPIMLSMVGVVVTGALSFLFRCWNRFMRHLNIRKHGWPPAHCDADGDYPPLRAKDPRVDP